MLFRSLETRGYTSLSQAFSGSQAYSTLCDGMLGHLDYALASASLLPQVTGTTEWHINADEVNIFDYKDGVLDAQEALWDRKSNAHPVYSSGPLRLSDHDPILVGLHLTSPSITPD